MADINTDRIRCRVGFVSEIEAKISIVTFNSKPVLINVEGGEASVSELTAQGTDHPSFDHLCHTAVATITGLESDTRYTYSLTHEGETLEGSFHTLGAESFSVLQTTCESSSPQQQPASAVWGAMRSLIESRGIIARAHIDDLYYFDTYRISNKASALSDPETGISQSGVPQVTEQSYDYVVAWMAWYGMFPAWHTIMDNSDRQWIMRNIANWSQLGDHEFYGDANAQVAVPGDDAKMGWLPALQAKCETLWQAFIADAGCPVLRSGEYYWGVDTPSAKFVAYDRVTHAKPYNAADSGDTHSYADPDSGWAGTHAGDATDPTLTEMGLMPGEAPKDFLGDQQVTDILEYLDDDHPFKIVFGASSISGHNQPYADWWPEEWLDFIGRKPEMVKNNDFSSGLEYWTGSSTAALSVDAGRLIILNDSGGSGRAENVVTGLRPGIEYTVTVTIDSGAATAGRRLRIGTTSNGTDLVDDAVSGSGDGPYTYTFTPTTGTVYINLVTNSASTSVQTVWRDVSIARSSADQNLGLMQNPKLNGAAGKLAFVAGDVHTPWVIRFASNGVDGLGKTHLDNGAIWEFNSGTCTGSGVGALNQPPIQGGTVLHSYQSLGGTGKRPVACVCVIDVAPDKLSISHIRLPHLRGMWTSYELDSGQSTNNFQTSEQQFMGYA